MKFVKESRIAAAPEVVFSFHESPGALRRLIPPWEKMEVAEHTEYDPPRLFADRQVSGPFARWYHRHRFLDDGQGGTLLRDEVEWRPPLDALGRWLGGWLVRRKLRRMFDYRQEVTRRTIESGEWQLGPGRHPMGPVTHENGGGKPCTGSTTSASCGGPST